MILIFLTLAILAFFGMAFVLFLESNHEQEKRAVIVGVVGMLIAVIMMVLVYFVPILIDPLAILFAIAGIFGLSLCIPGKQNPKALKGTMGYAIDEISRFDESHSVFVRLRGLPEGSDPYKTFYGQNPGLEAPDKKRREKGFLGKLGNIDKGYQANVAMVHSAFELPHFLGPFAKGTPYPDTQPANLSPEKATKIVKKYAEHVGAVSVGICELNPAWVYSKRGEIHYDNWEDWGKEIKDLPKYAVVMLLEMNRDHVMSAPHTPSVAESALNYAKGAYVSTMMARWFVHMGYRGEAEHTRNYNVIMPPVAVDAGLGEVGRHGYLITPKFGARTRIFVTLTDMPLIPDQPISIGVEEFCEKCMKCADSCPSKSIPSGPKTNCRGIEKWKLDEDSCFNYWSRVGTDCSICMAICPFSRPNSYFHRFIRWFVAYSPIAKKIFPHIDNFIYGKRWKAKKVPDWLSYPKRSESEDYPTTMNDSHY